MLVPYEPDSSVPGSSDMVVIYYTHFMRLIFGPVCTLWRYFCWLQFRKWHQFVARVDQGVDYEPDGASSTAYTSACSPLWRCANTAFSYLL